MDAVTPAKNSRPDLMPWFQRSNMKQIVPFAVVNSVEGSMPVAIALIFGVAVLAVCLIGILWTLALLLPFYAYIGAAVYLIWRGKQKEAELAKSFERETLKERLFNEQELRAWQDSLEKDRKNLSPREKALCSFGRTRRNNALSHASNFCKMQSLVLRPRSSCSGQAHGSLIVS
jgi:hypothetical protein